MILVLLHLVVYCFLITYFYRLSFIKLKTVESTVILLENQINRAIATHQDECSKPYKLLLFLLVMGKTLGIMGVLILSAFYYEILPKKNYEVLELNIHGIKAVVMLFLMIGFIAIIFYPYKNKRYLVRNFTYQTNHGIEIATYEVSYRAVDFRLVTRLGFYIILLIYPLFVVSINQYAYYNEDEIILKGMFDLSEKTLPYDELTSVERYFTVHRFKDEVTNAHYVLHFKDKKVDILFPLNTKQAVEIHQILLKERPDLFKDYVFNEKEIEFIESKRNEVKQDLYIIFS